MPDTIQDLNVTVNNIIFSNPAQGFVIFSVTSEEKDNNFVAKGYVGDLDKGDSLTISGKWVKHPKFGEQVQIEKYKLPEIPGGEDILGFLKSGFIKGVGPALAKAIVKHFGDKTTDVLNNDHKRLLEVSGIGKKKIKTIVESWRENFEKRNIIVQLQEWGIGPATIQKIYKKWPEPQNIIPDIKSNPYLLTDIDNVGFLIADRIAQNIGVPKDSIHRIGSAILFVLEEAGSKEGHVYLGKKDVIKRTFDILSEQDSKQWYDKIKNALNELCENNKVIIKEENVYHPKTYFAEQSVAKNILRLSKQDLSLNLKINTSELLKSYEAKHHIMFDQSQKQAIKSILDNKVSIVTGGPGTGKTTIVNSAVDILRRADIEKIALVAPTGRAAKRLEESTGYHASTIHRYLKYNPNNGFEFNSSNKTEDELIICDEASMLDVYLAHALVSALPDNARLVFIGDVYQLPSVGAGNILKDMISSERIPTTILQQIHRQEEGSWISLNAHAVKNGKVDKINTSNKTSDFFWANIPLTDENKKEIIPHERCKMVKERIFTCMYRLFDLGYNLDDIQILTPMRKTSAGVTELNNDIQNFLNKKYNRKVFQIGFKKFAVGDRVMQLKNNYEKEVFNGDQGKIVNINEDESKLCIQFGESRIEFQFIEAEELDLAYACTIHKSQGSEYKIAIIPVTTSHFIMLQRNLLYTAITRAKQMCVLVGEKKALSIAVKNNKPVIRNTTLKESLSS